MGVAVKRGERVLVKTSAGWWPGSFYRRWPTGIVAVDIDAVEGRRRPRESRSMQCDGGGSYFGVEIPKAKVASCIRRMRGQRVVF